MNAVRCLTCDTVIESTHRHDFKWCNCPHGSGTEVAVDGGSAYSKRCFGNDARWEEIEE